MITNQQHQAFHQRQNARWQSLSSDEKLKEFRELTQSPYWRFLPEEIKTRIRSLVTSSAPTRHQG